MSKGERGRYKDEEHTMNINLKGMYNKRERMKWKDTYSGEDITQREKEREDGRSDNKED